MGFGDFLFKKQEDTKPASSNAAKVGGVKQPSYTPTPIMVLQTAGKNDYMAHLDGLMDNSNMPGPDYYEFAKGIQKMASAPLTEEAKFQTVFGNFEIMGLTVPKLEQTATQYIGILDKEKMDFDKQLEDTRNTDVVEKQRKIEQRQQEIVSLNAKVQEAQASIQSLTTEKLNSENELNVEGNNFNNAYNLRKESINSDLQKIKTYLYATK